MSFININQNLEIAIANILVNSGSYTSTDFTVYNGLDTDIKLAPAVIVSCPSIVPFNEYNPVQIADVDIIVKNNIKDVDPTTSVLSNEIFDTIANSNLSDYNVSGAFSVIDIVRNGSPVSTDNDNFIQTHSFRFYLTEVV